MAGRPLRRLRNPDLVQTALLLSAIGGKEPRREMLKFFSLSTLLALGTIPKRKRV